MLIAAEPELASAIAKIIVAAKNRFIFLSAIIIPVIAVKTIRINTPGLVSSI